MSTKQTKISEYNQKTGYNITGIKRMSTTDIASRERYGYQSLYDLYDNPSDRKVRAWHEILRKYQPRQILAVAGNCMDFSVLLIADNGDVLHITKCNNYLVEVR